MKQLLTMVRGLPKEIFGNLLNRIVSMYQLKDNYRDLAPIDNISNGKEYLTLWGAYQFSYTRVCFIYCPFLLDLFINSLQKGFSLSICPCE